MINKFFCSFLFESIELFPNFSIFGPFSIFNKDIFKYFSTLSCGFVMLIGNSIDKTPFLTNIISLIISPSLTKISFLYATTALNAKITRTIKSVFWKFLKKIKFSITGLYIS